MLSTTPDATDCFLNEIVAPTVKEFLKRPDDIRLGKVAAIILSSLADYFVHARPSLCSIVVQNAGPRDKMSKHWEEWSKLCPEAGLVRDVGDATKHVRLTRPTAKLKEVSGIKTDEVLLADGDSSTLLFSFEDGEFPLSLGVEVVAVLPDGTSHSLVELLRVTWIFFLQEMGRSPAWPPS